MIKPPLKPIPLNDILQFIRCYRALEQMPLEDGFAYLRAAILGEDEDELKELRQHFRNQWYDKERYFGQFYLNLSHFRQIYLLHHWNIRDWQDDEFVGTALRNPYFRIVARPPGIAIRS